MDFEYIDALVNDPKAIIYVRDLTGKYVWVNDTYGEELPFSRTDVIGKTNEDLYGKDASNKWRIADELAAITRDPIITREELRDKKKFRYFMATKLVVTIEGEVFIVGISVEMKNSNATAYEQKIGQLRARLIERIKEPPNADPDPVSSHDGDK